MIASAKPWGASSCCQEPPGELSAPEGPHRDCVFIQPSLARWVGHGSQVCDGLSLQGPISVSRG